MTKRKYNIDDNYFNEIDTERKAYILGLMYADGCVYPNSAKLDLKTEDIKLLEDIALEMKNNCPIKTYKYKKKSYFHSPAVPFPESQAVAAFESVLVLQLLTVFHQ